MKSVVWNDCIQFVVYIAGAILAAGVILAKLPEGWVSFSDFATKHPDKFQLLDFSFDLSQDYTFWSGLVGGLFLALATHGTDQLMVQRYLGARSQKEAGRALALSGFVVCGQFALFLLIGVGLACFYQFHPLATTLAKDEVFAAFIVDYLPPGVVGITLAAVFSAAMSTLSSSLNSSAAAAVNDFYLPLRKEKPSPRRLLWVSRGLTVLFGLVQIGIAIAGGLMGMQKSVVNQVLAIAGFTAGPTLGVFFLGVLTRRATQPGALVGLLAGLGVLTTIQFTTDLAWPWYALVGSSVTFVAGLGASVWLPNRNATEVSGNGGL
jgi:SSS family solute:Na+ symporter